MTLPTVSELLQQDRDQWNNTLLACLQSTASESEILNLLQEALQHEPTKQSLMLAIADVIWLLSSLQSDSPSSSLWIACLQLLSSESSYLFTTLDPSLLEQAGLLPPNINTEAFFKKIRLYNTSTFYKQQKYNLLAEESEGYAKYLALLTSTCPNVEASRTIMATFHLDPNRCLDLCLHIISVSEERRDELLPVLFDAAPTNKLAPLLYFQLQESPHQPALLKCMAWLTQQSIPIHAKKLLPMEQMWSYLWGPEQDEALNELYQMKYQQDVDELKALSKVSLSGGSTAEKQNNGVDLSKLAKELAVQWLPYIMDHEESWFLLEDHQWSQLFTLFPNDLGVAACAALRKQDWWIQASKRILPPWNPEQASDDSAGSTIDDVLGHVMKPLFRIAESGCVQYDPILYSQLCRILALCLRENKKEHDSEILDRFLQTFLLPSLSLFPSNPAISHDLWGVLQEIPYRRRYKLYAAWRGKGLEKAALREHNTKPIWLIRGELEAGKSARYSLKRLSKDTYRDISRSIAQVCFSQPLVVFTTILNQIESYDNLVGVMVDALMYVAPLSLDVLGFCILSRLSGSSGGGLDVNRSRLKEDGVNVSQWLQSLESFTGEFYKRFPAIECRGIFGYLMHRLKEGHVMELGVLRTLLKTSGGWSFADYAPAASLSTTQVEGRAGSTLLKRETMSFGVHVSGAFNFRSSQQVRNILQEQDMGVILLILLSQVRNQIVYGDSDRPKPVKLIGNLYDTCQVTIAILLDFLTNPTDDKDAAISHYARSLPSLTELHNTYMMDMASAWMLCRPLLQAAERMELGRKHISIKDNLLPFISSDESRKSLEGMLPPETWSHISSMLFETFFSHSLYDLFCPEDVYNSEISRLDREVERLSNAKNTASSDATELERVKNTSADLAEDMVVQASHVDSIRKIIEQRKDSFFPSTTSSKEAMATFFTRCIYPRCMQGPDDAMYCARFIQLLHEMGTPGFNTLTFYDCAIIAFSRSLYGLTEGEAANVSIFLRDTWKLLSNLRYDDNAFASEVAGKPGCFVAANDPKFSLVGVPEASGQEDGDDVQSSSSREVTPDVYEQFYNKWHASIGATSIGALQSKEYMHKRCCLIVLSRMIDVYPTRPKTGNKLLTVLEPLQSESNTLADIRAAAQAYSMQLVKARDDGVWKEEDAATVQARQEKEQADAAARQKKAEEQMEEMKRESEKISEEIGEWRGRPGDRRVTARSYESNENRRGEDWRGRGAPPSAPSTGRSDGRYAGAGSYSSMGRAPRREEDGRRPRTGGDSSRINVSGAKRSRPPSPSEQDSSNKRARSQLEPGEEASSRGNDDGGRRRGHMRSRGKERR
ncbi:THO complex subunit 2 [Fistulifera solaris]|uniref:THO complex subunit 2 n=1 Tax=Fistulifera solaris TaxID=1519565 RepID=A0A1Z5JLE1_FISSO|nr:THO complex subunit 2 [Fistulifera solaris]|eukprot:GAX14835.1 THO complex subunit 2 [Fistulifera solaris]